MNVRFSTAAVVAATAVLSLVGCRSGGGFPHAGGVAPVGDCSDPNPSYVSLTFAGVVCIQGKTWVHQEDGSSELVLRVAVTNKDPNAFHVTSTDFDILDTAGHDVPAEDAQSAGRAGVRGCVHQALSDDGWPLAPGGTFAVPGPLCFNLPTGSQPGQLIWQGDVSVPVASR